MNTMVSIVVPVYHAEKYIRETMDSVLAQTYDDWELLLVVDGSDDPTIDVIEDYVREKQEVRIRLKEVRRNLP